MRSQTSDHWLCCWPNAISKVGQIGENEKIKGDIYINIYVLKPHLVAGGCNGTIPSHLEDMVQSAAPHRSWADLNNVERTFPELASLHCNLQRSVVKKMAYLMALYHDPAGGDILWRQPQASRGSTHEGPHQSKCFWWFRRGVNYAHEENLARCRLICCSGLWNLEFGIWSHLSQQL